MIVQREAVGDHEQDRGVESTQRELARLANLSDPYVSQIERGRHDPSIRVLRGIAEALNIRADTILSYAGWLQGEEEEEQDRLEVERAILADDRLSSDQQKALISTYHAFLSAQADR